jgi:hypothetical protein
MAEIIKPTDLSPEFLKRVEDRYGEVNVEEDFFSPNLATYYKYNPKYKSEGGGKEHIVLRLASFVDLYKNLGQAKNSAKSLYSSPDLKGDVPFQNQANQIIDTFNDFRTYFRRNYPDQYSLVKSSIKEMSTSGAAGPYNTPYAFKKKGSKPNISQYTSIGYKPVNQKELRKKSKGTDYINLYKD